MKQRTGDFSANTTVPIYMPGGTKTAQYPNNVVTNIDPAAAKLMALLPLPNSIGTYDAVNHRATNNYVINPALTLDYTRWVSRVDEQLTAKDRLNFVFCYYKTAQPLAVIYNSPLLNSNYDCICTKGYIGAIDYTRVWTPSLVTDMNIGFFRYATFRNPPGSGINASSQLGIASLPLDETPEILTSTGDSATQGAGALSINAGIRYEFEAPQTVSNNIYSRVNESNGRLLAATLNASRSLKITTAKLDFSPRIGFAYSPTNKTVIRGAYGNFYGTVFQNLGGQIAYPGFDTNVSFVNQGTAVP